MEEFKPNSFKYKDEQKKLLEEPMETKDIKKVVKGNVKVKKKSDASKLADVFISEDVANVKSYILMDVLVPAIKKAISDIVTNGIDMILYGESRAKGKSSAASKISYQRYYDRQNDHRDYNTTRTTHGYDYDNIIFDNRGEAEEVLSRMDEIVDQYGIVSVGDLYDLVGITGSYTDNKYGWTDIRNASVIRTKDGYLLKLPKALPLN